MKKIVLLMVLVSLIGFSQNKETSSNIVLVEMKPVFPKCKDLIELKMVKCNDSIIRNIINKNLDNDLITKYIPKKSKIKISFYFGIDGKVKNVKSIAPNNNIMVKNEIERTMLKLPTIIPAMQNGHKVRVKYRLNLYIN